VGTQGGAAPGPVPLAPGGQFAQQRVRLGFGPQAGAVDQVRLKGLAEFLAVDRPEQGHPGLKKALASGRDLHTQAGQFRFPGFQLGGVPQASPGHQQAVALAQGPLEALQGVQVGDTAETDQLVQEAATLFRPPPG
jgi:hypothetical protein